MDGSVLAPVVVEVIMLVSGRGVFNFVRRNFTACWKARRIWRSAGKVNILHGISLMRRN
jgi:hypothetical protein